MSKRVESLRIHEFAAGACTTITEGGPTMLPCHQLAFSALWQHDGYAASEYRRRRTQSLEPHVAANWQPYGNLWSPEGGG